MSKLRKTRMPAGPLNELRSCRESGKPQCASPQCDPRRMASQARIPPQGDREADRDDLRYDLHVFKQALPGFHSEFASVCWSAWCSFDEPRKQRAFVVNQPAVRIDDAATRLTISPARTANKRARAMLEPRSSLLKKIYVGNLPFTTTDT